MYSNARYGVFGLAKSGLSTIDFLLFRGFSVLAWDDNQSHICVAEEKYPECQFAELSDNEWTKIDILILSPGVPLFFPKPHPIVELVRSCGGEIICDVELFFRFFPNHIYIGVTGTNGKSTTTALIGHILEENNIHCKVVGNIGTPILSEAPEKDDVIVIEISSYQLDLVKMLKFHAAILLNIAIDHISRHGSIDNYISTKYKIFEHQNNKDFAIIGTDNQLKKDRLNELITDLDAQLIEVTSEKKQGTNILSTYGNILSFDDRKIVDLPVQNSLLGAHNQENVAAAYACISSVFRLSDEAIVSAIRNFKSLPHRAEYLGSKGGVTFINDSKATNFDSMKNSLNIFDNIYLIAGGVAKEDGIGEIYHYQNKIIKVFLIGQCENEFAIVLDKLGIDNMKSNNLKAAFYDAVSHAEKFGKNSVVLLSPAAASFDQWKNFEERGDYFRLLVEQYLKSDD